MNLKILIKVILITIVAYCILSIIRSLGLLFLTYTDNYFYNFDFKKEQFLEKKELFYRFYYYLPYIAGAVILILFKRFFKINLLHYIIGISVGTVVFRLVDSEYIRPVFAFFENTRTNIWILLLTFVIIGTTILILNKKNNIKESYSS